MILVYFFFLYYVLQIACIDYTKIKEGKNPLPL